MLLCFLSSDFIIGIIGENGKKIVKSLAEVKEKLTECAFADACGAFGPGIGERVLQNVYDKYKDQIESKKDKSNQRSREGRKEWKNRNTSGV